MLKPILVLISIATLSSTSTAQQVTILQAFDQLSPEDLSTAIVRIEYRGESEKLPAVVFTTEGTKIDWKRLRIVPGLQIGDSEERYTRLSFAVTVEDMKHFLETAKRNLVPRLDAQPWLSMAVVAGTGNEEKAILGSVPRQRAGEFFILARNALRADPKDITLMNGAANYKAMNALQSFGCALGLLPEVIPAKDVTSAVAVTRGGLRFNFKEQRFESTISLKDISTEPIRAPISLVVDLSPNIALANAHARTCVTKPAGREFITLPLPTAVFKPGQILETVLVFTGAQGEDIEFTTRVLATPGER